MLQYRCNSPIACRRSECRLARFACMGHTTTQGASLQQKNSEGLTARSLAFNKTTSVSSPSSTTLRDCSRKRKVSMDTPYPALSLIFLFSSLSDLCTHKLVLAMGIETPNPSEGQSSTIWEIIPNKQVLHARSLVPLVSAIRGLNREIVCLHQKQVLHARY